MYAEKAIEEGRYSDAALRLGQLLMNESLDDPEAQDYFLVGVEENETALVTQRLKAKAQNMIAELPPQAGRLTSCSLAPRPGPCSTKPWSRRTAPSWAT